MLVVLKLLGLLPTQELQPICPKCSDLPWKKEHSDNKDLEKAKIKAKNANIATIVQKNYDYIKHNDPQMKISLIYNYYCKNSSN